MSNRESEEPGDLSLKGSPENLAMRAADAQEARSAVVSDVKAAQDTNPNKHNGSAGGDQLESIQIIALDEGGKQKVVAERPKGAKPQPEITPEYLRERAKQSDIWAKKFVEDIDKAEKLPAPYKDAQIHAEASCKKGQPVPWGKLGSSRVDIALGEHEKPFVSMCLKTLGAVPSAQQERGWLRNLPRFYDDSVIPRIYFKLGK